MTKNACVLIYKLKAKGSHNVYYVKLCITRQTLKGAVVLVIG